MIKTIFISSKIENISVIESLVDQISVEHSLGSEVYGNVLIALIEAVTNSILHGNKLDASKQVKVSYLFKDDFLEFVIADEGKGFDLNHIPDPTKPKNVEKFDGRGIFLIRHLTDHVEYKRNGCQVIMRFKI